MDCIHPRKTYKIEDLVRQASKGHQLRLSGPQLGLLYLTSQSKHASSAQKPDCLAQLLGLIKTKPIRARRLRVKVK